MGLTIHYSLKCDFDDFQDIRHCIENLRHRALDLPFEQVGTTVELSGTDCDYESREQDDPHRWLLIQAGQYVDCPGPGKSSISYSVPPTHVIAFETVPGPGCEAANFGLCRYPATLQITGEERYVAGQGYVRPRRRIQTGLSGWRWSSFCKTQYASDRNYGGIENFLRCHLLVIKMLDHAKNLGILDAVSDEGEFWETRNVQALAQSMGQWNEMVAAFVGQLKDQLGDDLQAEIIKYPDFEHLEAKGGSAR